MTDVSLKNLSTTLKISVKELIKKLSNIGILKNEKDKINILEKNKLIQYIENNTHNTLTLQRKKRITLNISTIGGKNKAVQIEVRKQKTYIKNNILEKTLSQSKRKNTHNIISHQLSKKNHNEESNTIHPKKRNIEFNNIEEKSKFLKFYNTKNQEENNEIKKNKELSNNTININKIKQSNADHWQSNQDEDTDYHITTFSHARQAEDDNDQAVEIDNKNRNRHAKNYRTKKNTKQYHDSKNQKDNIRVNIRNKKNYKKRNKSMLLQQIFQKPKTIINRNIFINETITVFDLANKMSIKSAELIKTMMNMGIIGTINQVLDQDTAQLIAEERGHQVTLYRDNLLEEKIMKDRDIGNNIAVLRAPIVTIMGHVDHGKTSLLDYIRTTKITSLESGGITQNIGAYHVKTNLGSITFLDTPGHSAFTAMRSRGVKVTDIVVLVVAADDGVMPQTIEAIQHAQAASIPIIVAINKIDKIESDIEKVKNDLMKYEIVSEDWGGQNIFVSISAKKGIGINKLLSAILLQAEMLELTAISTGMAEGIVIESSLDKGRGPIATVLIKKGCLKKGDVILCGLEYGRVKTLRNEIGESINNAGPSIPVEVLGLSKVPFAGDIVTVVRDEKKAREVALYRQSKSRDIKLATQQRVSLDTMFENIKKYDVSELKIILKSDVQGSLEAISGALVNLSTKDVKINIIGLGIGGITETDASLALASNAIILGFNVRADSSAKKIIHLEKLDIRYYSVIYHLLDEVKLAMNGLLSPEYTHKIIGLAEVRNVFKSPKFGFVAGCMVFEGMMKRNSPVRVLRNNIVIYEGELESLRRFKEDVSEIRNGMECGIAIKNYNDVRIGDTIENFEMKEIKRIKEE